MSDHREKHVTPWGRKKQVPLWFLVLACLAFPTTLLLAASFQPSIFRDRDTTWHLLSSHVLFLHGITFVVVSLGVLIAAGRLRPGDIGLELRHLPSAAGTLLVVWGLEQLVLLGLVPLGLSDLTFNEAWQSGAGASRGIGRLFANTVGTGLNEETFFRGFLFVQLYMVFAARADPSRWNGRGLVLAALLSSLLFAILHFQVSPGVLAQLTIGGLIGSAIYARTRNLFVGIVLHGLFNAPLPVLSCSPTTAKVVVLTLLLLVAVAWRTGSGDGRPADVDREPLPSRPDGPARA